ncbi:hypothetical protein IHV25_01605 [Phaeovibrio sulfidiphilus]|uniref:Uncharacterized protein n=1 Tax=Phaeovibrio sulfidiphilus TaxID=1220600 RepID=A0A8J7CCY3_9PROT|nr:hypothetical protein [Phaeovibrio sulfidiphilus]MBE1236349.1 hypothetical protein [Phaeovibrio sulfidiphilus]
MSDALSHYSGRPSQGDHVHEVLRVAGFVPGKDPEAVSRAVIREVLKWAQKRSGGGRFPQEAWDGHSFDYQSPGRNARCEHFQSGDLDLWAIRSEDPDKKVAGRNWTTEVVVGYGWGDPVRFSARLLVGTSERDLEIEPHTPGLVRQIVDECGLVCDRPLAVAPTVCKSAEDTESLIEYLVDPNRKLPIFVVTLGAPGHSDHPTIVTATLGRAVLGIGAVYVLHPEATWRLTQRFGKYKSVFGGAARVYLPGFSDDADPRAHRLFLANSLETTDGGRSVAVWMQKMAARVSLLQASLGHDVLSFDDVRDIALQEKQKKLKSGDASADEQLEVCKEINALLREEVESLKSERDYYLEEYETERREVERLEAGVRARDSRIQILEDALTVRGGDPDKDIPLPESWSDFLGWCEENLEGRLVLASSARRGLRKPAFADVETAARCLLWLARDCRNQRISGGAGSINNIPIMDGIENANCGSDAYEFEWGGRKLSADWHIKKGGNTRDPSRCLRIYYCFDPKTQLIVVSDMPAHRRTGAT